MSSPERPARPLPFWDVPVTIALLLGGLYSATVSFAQAPQEASALDAYLESAGIGHYTNIAFATGAGYAAAGSELFALLLAIGFSVPRLRTRRRAFWIPLVAAVIGFGLSMVFTAIALFSDPALITYLNSSLKQ